MRSSKTAILLIGGFTALVVFLLVALRRTPEERIQPEAAPLVRMTRAQPVPYRFQVETHGTVEPRTESDLVPQVSGEVVWISPSLAAGGFFEADDVLARIDAADYRVDRESARATVARAESDFARADKEMKRQQQLANQSVASESRMDDAVNALKVAEASLREARARLERADRDLARTELKAPYRGRVRSKQFDVGQFVTRGTPIATLYAVDYAEIRLPIPDRELAFLDVPLVPKAFPESGEETARGARVALEAEFAGELHHWEGYLVRTEGELDPRSRMVHLVARVPDPYGLHDGLQEGLLEGLLEGLQDESPGAKVRAPLNTAPLAVGLFVEATIDGDAVEGVYVLPRDALRPGSQVYVIDDEGRIRFRDVEVLRTERSQVIIASGLDEGDRVCTSPLQAAVDGMLVRILEEPPALATSTMPTSPNESGAPR